MAVYAVTIGLALYFQSFLPLMLIGILPTMYGGWFSNMVGLTQHAGLAENVPARIIEKSRVVTNIHVAVDIAMRGHDDAAR